MNHFATSPTFPLIVCEGNWCLQLVDDPSVFGQAHLRQLKRGHSEHEGLLIYAADGFLWKVGVVPTQQKIGAGLWLRSMFDRHVSVPATASWQCIRSYSLDELKSVFLSEVEKHDDGFTQFYGEEEIAAMLKDAHIFMDVVAVLEEVVSGKDFSAKA